MRSLFKRLAVLALLTALTAGAAVATENRVRATVARVIDGDTIRLTNGQKVRLIGINAPETPHGRPAQPFGREATAFAKSLMQDKIVFLENDVEPLDKYGRALAYVYLEDGRFVNELLVSEGLAKARAYAPNVRYREQLKKSESKAKKARKGVWSIPGRH